MLWWTLRQLKSNNIQKRKHAVWKLVNLGNPKVVDSLITALKDENWQVRCEVAVALGEIRDMRAVESLIVALKDSDKFVSYNAALSLGKIGDKRAIEPLIVALIGSDWSGRRKVAKALQALRYEPTDEMQQAWMFVANGQCDDAVKLGAPAVEPLIAALNVDYSVNFESDIAVEALVKISDAAVEPLIVALKDSDWYVQTKVAKALGEIGDARAVEPLIVALKDSEGSVCYAVVASLISLGWLPKDQIQSVWLAIAQENFADVLAAGAIAIGPLISITKDGHHAAKAVQTLQSLLYRDLANVTVEDLRAIANLPIIYEFVVNIYSSGHHRQEVNCSYLRRLARKELLLRGIEV